MSQKNRGIRSSFCGRRSLGCIVPLSLLFSSLSLAQAEEPLGARHAGLGGAVQAAGGDASALLNNPAGLSSIKGADVWGGLTLRLRQQEGGLLSGGETLRSAWQPSFLPAVAGAFSWEEWLKLGIGLRPVLKRGVAYEAPGTSSVREQLSISAYELSPAFAVTVPEAWLPGRLSWGIGYRLMSTWASGEQEAGGSTGGFSSHGLSATGLRTGLQYSVLEELRLGLSFQNGVRLSSSGSGTGEGESSEAQLDFYLPAQLAGGLRFDLDRFGLTFDYAYQWGSKQLELRLSEPEGGIVPLHVRAAGQNAHSIRSGLEYRSVWGRAEVPLRIGYAWQGARAVRSQPTPFLDPPAPLQSLHLGVGYVTRQSSFAFSTSYRWARAELSSAERASGCSLCGPVGNWSAQDIQVALDAAFQF